MNKQITLSHFLKLSAASLVVLFSIEFGLRLHYRSEDKIESIIVKDNDLGWDFKGERKLPFPLKFNDLGVRENNSSDDLIKEKEIVAFLGNSVVMAQHVLPHETFVKKIQRLNPQSFCLNAGFDGFELYREVIKLKRDVLRLQNIKQVVWFPNRNDLKTNEDVQQVIAETARLQNLDEEDFLSQAWNDYKKQNFFIRPSAAFQGFIGNVSKSEDSFTTDKDIGYSEGIRKETSPAVLNSLKVSLMDLQEVLKARKIQMKVVFLPSRHYSELYDWKSAKAFHQIEFILKELGIDSIQLLDKFHEAKNPHKLFIDAVHLNSKGHNFVALKLNELRVLR